MAEIKVAVINATSVLTNAEVEQAMPALQTQVHRDFAPAWGIDADLSVVPKGKQPPAGMWWLALLDNSDQAGALGYHDVTSEGLPLGKVFAGTDKQYGYNWTVTASHELLEMLGDPEIDLTVFVERTVSSGELYAYEVCDACEADQYGYQINGTTVSDFVYPAWFESFRKPTSTQFDYQKKINAPFKLLPGGYIGVYDVTGGSGWRQLTAEEGPYGHKVIAPRGSRRERHARPRVHWLRSNHHRER
jgi:hypothetical protein